MPNGFCYSVAVRTLGTAGEKYEKLMRSIRAQTIQPERIVVVLPHGFKAPGSVLGTEEFVYSDKGMVPQRLAALDYIESDYTLFCDDDVELIPEFAERLADALLHHGFQCAAGPLLSFFPPRGPLGFFGSVVGEACVMLRGRKNTYVRILGTGGYSYNYAIDTSSHKIYNTESLPGTCFCVQTEAMRNARMQEELWLEKNGFAAWEDRVMLSKLLLTGSRACVVSDAAYEHHDAKTSVKKLKLEPVYARGFNRYVYWFRFLYTPARSRGRRAWLRICSGYYRVLFNLYLCLRVLVGKSGFAERAAWDRGFRNAKRYVRSDEYRQIPAVIQIT